MINILKTNFKIDTYMNASVNRMDNVIVDVFSDQKGIDPNNSAYTYDASQKLVKNNTTGSSITHNSKSAFETWQLDGMSLDYPSGFGPAPVYGEILPKLSIDVLNDDGKQKGNVVVDTDHEGFIHMAYEAKRVDSNIWGVDYAILSPEGQIIRKLELIPGESSNQYVVGIGAASFVEWENGRIEGPVSYVITRHVDTETSSTCYELRVVLQDTVLSPIDISYMKTFSRKIVVDELGHGHFCYIGAADNKGYWTKVWVEDTNVKLNTPHAIVPNTSAIDIALGRGSFSNYAAIIGGNPNARIITNIINRKDAVPLIVVEKRVNLDWGFWVEYANPGLWLMPGVGTGAGDVLTLKDMQLNQIWSGLGIRFMQYASYDSAIYRLQSSSLQPIIQEAETARASSYTMSIPNASLLICGPVTSLVLVKLSGNGYRLYIWKTPRYTTQLAIASRIFDGGGPDTVWTTITWTIRDTTVIGYNKVEYRLSNDLETWSDWSEITSGAAINQASKYLELRVTVLSSGPGPYYQNFKINFNATVSVVQSQPILTETVPKHAVLCADFNPGSNGSVRFYLSRDGGAVWIPAIPDVPVHFEDCPEGTSLVMKAELAGDAVLSAWGLAWS